MAWSCDQVQAGYQEKVLHQKSGQSLEQTSQGSGHGTELTTIQKVFGHCSQTTDIYLFIYLVTQELH